MPPGALLSGAQCADTRCTRANDDLWERTYGDAARVCASQTDDDFSGVLEEVSAEQVAKQVLGLPAGTAEGHDGVSVGLLKVLVDGAWLRLGHQAAGPAMW